MRAIFRILSRKFLALILIGIIFPALIFYSTSYLRSSGHDRGLKLIHKDSSYRDGGNLSVAVRQVQLTTPHEGDRESLTDYVSHMCHRLGMNPGTRKVIPSMFNYILVDDRFKVLYCQIPKVACTNWRRVFLVLSGKVKVRNVLELQAADVHGKYAPFLTTLSDLTADEIRYRLDNYYKFAFVREPFERLLSAYRNKFTGNTKAAQYFKDRFGSLIIKRFREPAPDKLVKGGKSNADVQFEEFLQYLVDSVRQEPLNEHWNKYYKLCHPCTVEYDFLGKYETINEDALKVLRAIHADHIVKFPVRELSYNTNKTSSLLSRYYKDVPASLLKRVYKAYQTDFVLFNYSVPLDMKQLLLKEE